MHVQPHDVRPPTLLGMEVFNPGMWLGGALTAALAHVGVPLLVFALLSALTASGASNNDALDYIDEHVVEAHFVQLGKIPDPKKLPDRIVPRKTTAPDQSTVVSKKPREIEKPDAGVRPQDPEEDPLLRLGDRAKAFAEIAEEREREGHPDGLVDGTETEARLGDIYRGKLVAFFKRGWTIPTTMQDVDQYKAVTQVEITPDLHVGPFSLTTSSGEPLFDQSIEDRLNQLRSLGTTLPEPPAEVADEFLGKTITVRWSK